MRQSSFLVTILTALQSLFISSFPIFVLDLAGTSEAPPNTFLLFD
jgi:hypothetical protein